MGPSENLLERVAAIEARNRNVEIDKAWETSATRKISILVITYLIATLTFVLIGTETPHIMAIIPTLGYGLSTLTLPFLRRHWEKSRSARK